MLESNVVHTKANTGSTYFNEYDAGTIIATTNYAETILDQEVQQLLIFPKVECLLKVNGSEKEIYIPADMWTPILLRVNDFKIKGLSEGGTLYWQGWYL